MTNAEQQQIIQSLVRYYELNIKDRMSYLGSYVMDIYKMNPEVDDDGWYFIEPNPFGAEYSSGSSLFHWHLDEQQLLGNIEIIEFRYSYPRKN